MDWNGGLEWWMGIGVGIGIFSEVLNKTFFNSDLYYIYTCTYLFAIYYT